MSWINSFRPVPGGGVYIANGSVTATSSNVQITKPSRDLLVSNIGVNGFWIALGTSSAITAVKHTGMYVGPGKDIIVRAGLDITYLAAVCDTGLTSGLEACPGEGA